MNLYRLASLQMTVGDRISCLVVVLSCCPGVAVVAVDLVVQKDVLNH